MTMSVKEVVDHVSSLEDLKSNVNNFFALTHAYDEDESNTIIVEAPYSIEVFETIVAYIQFLCDEIEDFYGMSQEEVGNVLASFYDCKIASPKPPYLVYNIDLYDNWEIYCGSYPYNKIMGNKLFVRNGLSDYLIEMMENG